IERKLSAHGGPAAVDRGVEPCRVGDEPDVAQRLRGARDRPDEVSQLDLRRGEHGPERREHRCEREPAYSRPLPGKRDETNPESAEEDLIVRVVTNEALLQEGGRVDDRSEPEGRPRTPQV